MLGHFEIKLDAREADGGQNTGHQNDGDETRKDQKEKIVTRIERGESDEQRAENVDPTGARDLVLHLVADPAERCALGERRDECDGDPGSDGEREQRTSSGEEHVAQFGGDARVKRKNERDAQRDHRKEKRADRRPIGFRPELRDGGWMSHGKLQRNTDGIDDFAQRGFRRFRFALKRRVARAGDDAMRKDRHSKLFKIVRQAEISAIEKSASLRGPLKHQGPTRTDAERKLIGFARTVDDIEGIVLQARIHFDVRDGFLHGEDFFDVRDRF